MAVGRERGPASFLRTTTVIAAATSPGLRAARHPPLDLRVLTSTPADLHANLRTAADIHRRREGTAGFGGEIEGGGDITSGS